MPPEDNAATTMETTPQATQEQSAQTPQPAQTPPAIDPNEYNKLKSDYERANQRLAGHDKLFRTFSDHGLKSAEEIEEAARAIGEARKRGLDIRRLPSMFDPAENDGEPGDGPREQFDPHKWKDDVLNEWRTEQATSEHQRAQEASLSRIEKEIDSILGDDFTASEKAVFKDAAENTYWRLTARNPYDENHPLKGSGRPAEFDKVREVIADLKSKIEAERAAMTGDQANRPPARKPPAAGSSDRGAASGTKAEPPSRSEREKRMEKRIAAHSGRQAPMSQT